MRLCLADIPTVAAHEKLEASDMTREHIHPNEKQSESLHSALVDSFDEFAPPINFSRQQIEAETEARIVAWLRDKEGAWRYWSRHLQDVGSAHMPQALASALERGEHRKDRDEG